MEPLLASDILIFILSICLILITGAIVIGVYFFLGVIKDAQLLIQTIRGEVETFREKRRGMEVSGRTFFKVAKILLSWVLLRKK